MEQVILNILTNSIKYTKEKGKIEILVYEEDSKSIISIIDNGMGIKDEDIERVFERFYRVQEREEDFKDIIDGAGLGLYISREIVKKHGGSITIKSEYNVGTQVNIIIPKIEHIH